MDWMFDESGCERVRRLKTECLEDSSLHERYAIRIPTFGGSYTVFDEEGFMHDFVFSKVATNLAEMLDLPLYEFDDPVQPNGHGRHTIERIARGPCPEVENDLDVADLELRLRLHIIDRYHNSLRNGCAPYWMNLATVTGLRDYQMACESSICGSRYLAEPVVEEPAGDTDISIGMTGEEMAALEDVIPLFEEDLNRMGKRFIDEASMVFSRVFPQLYTPYFSEPGVYVGSREVNVVFADIGWGIPGEIDVIRDICLRHQEETLVSEATAPPVRIDGEEGTMHIAHRMEKMRGYELHRPAADTGISFRCIAKGIYDLWEG